MADNFGSEQNRVLDVKDRSLDNVVFQYKHPPLTSEWNLINQIGNEKLQSIAKSVLPSGWLSIGNTLQGADELTASVGDTICSEDYFPNEFKMISNGNNIAMVNGWPLLIQGTDGLNSIIIDDSVGQAYDFVFLEVWRKLVGTDGYIYPYGNVNIAPYSDNEIEWNVVGCETTKRVQIQYRIRSVRIASSVIDATKEMFDIIPVHPIGGRTNGENNFYSFSKFGTSDAGLYVTGDGSDISQTDLGTVDGYVYAIPMYMVYRRFLSETPFNQSYMSYTTVDKDMMADDYRSDRPDGKVADIIYKEDVIDLRHKIGGDLRSSVETTISRLMSGELATTVKKGFGEDGATTSASSGGSVLMKVERLNSIGGDNIPDVGVGSLTPGSVFKRRAFCNAEITHDHNVIQIPTPIPAWDDGTFVLSSLITLPDGEIVSVDGFYGKDNNTEEPLLVTGVTSNGINLVIDSGASIVGTDVILMMEFTFKYASSSLGFKDVPREFLEVNKDNSTIIATRDNDITLRFNNSGKLLTFGSNPNNGTIDSRDFVRYMGGNYTDMSRFGHELVLHRTTSVSDTVTISLTDSKYNQYYILGVKSVEVAGTAVDFKVERLVSGTPPTYAITYYIVTAYGYPSTDVVVTLYTGSKFIQDVGDTYSVADSFKFFEMSKQGKGITDTYELIEAIGVEGALGIYKIDTVDKPIIRLATKAVFTGGYVEGTAFAFRFDSSDDSIIITLPDDPDNALPVLSDDGDYSLNLLPTIINVETTPELGKIRVPVLVHSYVVYNEAPYNFYYKTIPYQGLLNTTLDPIYGKVMSEEQALITTSGSGTMVDYYSNWGTANFTGGDRVVVGTDTKWTAHVKADDYIKVAGTSKSYRVLSVSTDTTLTLAESFEGSDVIDGEYELVRLDIPNSVVSNLVDKLPALSVVSSTDITEYTCYSDDLLSYSLSSEYAIVSDYLTVKALKKPQDPLSSITNDFMLGNSNTAKRGRNDFRLTINGNPAYKIGEGRPCLIYEGTAELPEEHNKKVYQFYVFQRSGKGSTSSDLMGKAYLMVVAGETKSESAGNTENMINPFFDKDVVDIFELVGRPIIKG